MVYRISQKNKEHQAKANDQYREESNNFEQSLQYLYEHNHINTKYVKTLHEKEKIEPGKKYGQGANFPLNMSERNISNDKGQNEQNRQWIKQKLNIRLKVFEIFRFLK